MERLRKSRRPLRALITRTGNEVDAELAKDPRDLVELRVRLERLQRVQQEIAELDQKVLDAMLDDNCTDDEQDAEILAIEQYQDSILRIKLRMNQALNPQDIPGSPTPSYASVAESSTTTMKKSFKLPKIELKKYNGDLKGWLGWWNQFKKIDEDDALHTSDKFQYLIGCMVPGSKAEDIVKAYPASDENYPKVIAAMKQRFGNEELLQDVYVREMLKLAIANSKKKDKVVLGVMFNQLESNLRSLESLGLPPQMMALFLYPMVETSLPEETLLAWQRSPDFGKSDPTANPPKTKMDYLLAFLRREVQNEEQRELIRQGFEGKSKDKPNYNQKGNRRDDIPTSACLLNQEGGGCIFCGKSNHLSQDCYKAAKMTVEEKRQKIKDNNCCFCCLKRGHSVKMCKSPIRCSFCNRKHYPALCQDVEKYRQEANKTKDVREISQGFQTMNVTQSESSTTCTNQIRRNKVVLMKTLHVRAKGTNGEERELRLLFDEGSQRSYIKTSIAKELNCQTLENLTLQNNLFGGMMTELKARKNYRVTLQGVGIGHKEKRDLKLVNEDVICGSCPIVPQGPWIKELAKKKIYITDTYADTPEIEILIGSDLWGTLMTGKMYKLKSGLIAVESIFGWTLSGEITPSEDSYADTAISMLSLPDMWSLEAIGIRDTAEQISQEEHDDSVKQNLCSSLSKDKDGRYIVNLPWVSKSIQIPTNRVVAEKRLLVATEKLKKQGELENYDKIFRDWEKEGIIESVSAPSINIGHYLPHRPVFKPESATTPVRPVFDASCKVGKNPSLNQCLEKGPNMMELIVSILLRFRHKEIGVISDIRKAFQMVGVAEEDREYQKFLWWEDESKRILKEYRHCRVVFGLNCSPFILAAVLDYHLSQVKQEDKPIAELVKKSLYVDNCVISLESKEAFKYFQKKSTAILSEAGMELRQWESSQDDSFSPETTTVLGLKWYKEEDLLFCQIPKRWDENLKITKRNVLSLVSQVYDPLGFTCPAVLQPKIMLQDSWAIEMDWDKEWNQEQCQKFHQWMQELPELGNIKIPRSAFGRKSPNSVQLHQFCDASKHAFASAIFVRVEEEEGISVQLLIAKSRLAPLDKKKLKRVTIPRLELMGCLIGARLMDKVKESLSIQDIPIYHWSDSTTALAWIKRGEDWGTFVGNRVRNINKLTRCQDWRHVPGDKNPADLPSRGCTPGQLFQSKWWEGPSWLKLSEEYWPNSEQDVDEDEVQLEKKKTVVTVTSTAIPVVEPRFSSFLKNVRVSGWVRRFIDNCKKEESARSKCDDLNLNEIRKGEKDLIQEVQRRHWTKPPIIKNISTSLKDDGLYRVKTRLTYRDDDDQFKYPILLPKDDPIVHQLINYVHRANGHAGAQFVLGAIRSKYWIIHGKKTVSRVIHKCVVCKRYSSKGMQSEPAPLPQNRIQTQATFQTTGVDLAGPLILKGGKKAWIVIYTCAVYRGVYLDIVNSISTDEFLDSLEKFTLLIGRPNTMMSDNGTNFVGAQNLLKKINWDRLKNKVGVRPINWIFNPPTAAWWGGWWERLVRSLKDLLRRMIGKAKLTQKELEMCLASISHTINNRPLTALTEDSDDLIPLTPAMFMRDLPISGLPEREEITSRDLQEAYKKIQNLKRALENRFRKEYLANLVQRKNELGSDPPSIGDVVLVGSDNKKRFEWPLGRILEVYPGKDNKIRVAKVKTSAGVLLRPIQRLYPLEVSTPKSIPVPQSIKNISIQFPEEKVASHDEPVTTRYGRKSKKPCRYDQWTY